MQVRTPICSKENKRNSTPKRFKIEPKSVQNRLPGRPRSLRGPECRPRAPESAPRGAPSDPKSAPGSPQGRPKRDQGRPKSAQRGPEGSPGTPRERQNRLQKRKKSNLRKVLRDSALAMFQAPRRPPDRPRIGSKSFQVSSSSPSSGLLDRLWSLEGASSGLGARLRSTRAASGAPRDRLSCAHIR